MTVDTFIHCAPHEGDLHLIFSAYGLGPYFAMDRVRKDHDGWKTTGKPTRTIHFDGDEWALAYDYDTDNPLDPREHQDYHLQSVPEFGSISSQKMSCMMVRKPIKVSEFVVEQ